MLASSSRPFDSEDHLFEIKWDGTRALCYVDGEDGLRLANRHDVDTTDKFPELAVLADLPDGTIIDGEIVVLEDGKPSFPKILQRVQNRDEEATLRMSQRLPATYVAFDVLYVSGRDVMNEPLSERRRLLAELLTGIDSPHLILSEFVTGQGCALFEHIKEAGIEGIVAKRLASRYIPDKRTDDWIKIKVEQTGTFHILGYTVTDPGQGVSSLLVAEWYRKKWMYKGRVGSGFSEADRKAMLEVFENMPELENPPPNGPRDAIWRDTGLQCEVQYFEKTVNGMLRGPVFKGMVV